MDTSGLRGFAVWARLALIREVSGRVAAVLAPGSVQRVEQPVAVSALERAVARAGGGEAGRAAVADTVAYTWFNRIIALRFMDANGYSGVGVVSPQAGVTVGQPEILADAKRGLLDAEVVGTRTQQTVMALLEGTRRSPDPQGEAYGLLLADYCRFWNQAMPFIFEPEGDFTELLMPANLLADDSVLNRAVRVLTVEVCADVEVIGWLYQFYISERKDEVFAGFKKNKKAGPAEIPAATQLFTPHWIVRYLVENSLGRLWMLNHPDSGLVGQMDYYIPPVDAETDFLKISSPEDIRIIDPACGSGHMLTYAFDLLYDIYQEEGYAASQIPGLILANNLYGTEIDQRAGSLAAFALTMKASARRKLFLKNPVQPNICVIEAISFTDDELDYLLIPHGDPADEKTFWNQFRDADLLGSLIQPDPHLTARLSHHLETLDNGEDLLNANTLQRAQSVISQAHYLQRRYAIAITNPPYMRSSNMCAPLASFAERRYRSSKSDLFAMFIDRCLDLVVPQGGVIAMITMQSWMFLSSFEKLRDRLLSATSINDMAHLGTRAFDSIGGAVVSTTAFILTNRASSYAGVYLRLVDAENEQEKRTLLLDAASDSSSGSRFVHANTWFRSVPGSLISYWLSDALVAAFGKGKPLAALAPPRNGLQTSDNGRFLRFWWEVSRDRTALPSSTDPDLYSDRRWFPYNKGGQFRRWYGNQLHVVNWENDGAQVRKSLNERYPYLKGNLGALIRATEDYFKPHVSWSAVGGGTPSFREYPAGLIFDAAANSLFPGSESLRRAILGVLNSSVAMTLLAALAPTMNIVVGDIAQLPIITPPRESDFGMTVSDSVESARADWDSFETSWDFSTQQWLVGPGELRQVATGIAEHWEAESRQQRAREIQVNRTVARGFGLENEVSVDVPMDRVSLTRNVAFRYGPGRAPAEYRRLQEADSVLEFVSYAVGCMFGRYSLDEPGLILADQGATLQSYLAKVPQPRFMPDADNVLPIVDGDWFEDDIVARFRQFLRAAFGEQHFEENLRFVTEALGVKDVRDYFVKSFYKDHVQRYKKRPIYWLFSSPKGSFNALIYMHRYTPTTVSTVLNEYLREFQTKVRASLDNAQRSNNAKEADRLRKVLVELEEYEHDVLYPLATQQISIDLDDGVKSNYPKLGKALKRISGLEKNQ